MTSQPRHERQEGPNHASDMEQAEGSRENLDPSDVPQEGAGITNRPLQDEQQEQSELPPRGARKDKGSHA